MGDTTSDASINSGDPVSLISSNGQDDLERTTDRWTGPQKILKDNMRKAAHTIPHRGSMQDRLLEKLLQQIIPTEELSTPDASSSRQHGLRPNFSLPTMSTNFRRFNTRIGVVFVFQKKVERLLSWNIPTHTLSFLAIYTFICLDPFLLFVLPLVILLLALLIPSFVARHPAPPPTITSHNFQYSITGPPLAPAPTIKPVKELSKDFFRNMRDLQNSMEDFSRIHDTIISVVTPTTNFSNEPLSSTLFHFAFFTTLLMFIASHLLPWRLIFLLLGWGLVCSSHPAVQRQMLSTHKQHIVPHEAKAKALLDSWIARDIILDSAPETREVEIFELQHLSSAGEWESWLFSTSPYDPLSEIRIKGERPRGSRFFEDVRPPSGWEWSGKKWALDLWSREWVEERIITGVEVETEGERWVYDIRYRTDDDEHEKSADDVLTTMRSKKKLPPSIPSWEEGSDAEIEGRGRRGEWRRRRWVRIVKRKWQNSASDVIHS